MPIYEYRCDPCGCDFEELVRSSDDEVLCPDCGSGEVGRKLSVFAFKSVGSDRPSASSAHSGCADCSSGSCSGGGCGGGCSHHH